MSTKTRRVLRWTGLVQTCLTGGSNSNGFGQLRLPWPGYPGNLTGSTHTFRYCGLAPLSWWFSLLCFCFFCMFVSYLWGKIFNVGLLLLQGSLRDKHGEIAVLHSQLPNLSIKEVLDGFPNGEGPGPQHIAAADVIILNHLCFSDDLEERELRPRAF